MKPVTQQKLQATLESAERAILTYYHSNNPYAVAVFSQEAKKTLEVYAKNLYISFFLKELKKKEDVTNDKLVIGILDYFANSLDLIGDPLKRFFTGLSEEIKRYKPRLGTSQSYQSAKAILFQLPDQIKNEFEAVNRFKWNLVVEVFEPTEDPRHPNYSQLSSVKSARSLG